MTNVEWQQKIVKWIKYKNDKEEDVTFEDLRVYCESEFG